MDTQIHKRTLENTFFRMVSFVWRRVPPCFCWRTDCENVRMPRYSWFYDFSIVRSCGIKFSVCRSITLTYCRPSTTVANYFFLVVNVRYLPTYLYSTMASDGSPRPTGRNMIEPSSNMAQTSIHYACAEATILERPRWTIFWLRSVVGGGFSVVGHWCPIN